jgi:hypothetical protein
MKSTRSGMGLGAAALALAAACSVDPDWDESAAGNEQRTASPGGLPTESAAMDRSDPRQHRRCGRPGKALWSEVWRGDGTSQVGWDIHAGSAGDVLVAGMFDGAMDLGAERLVSAGERDAFVAKLDRSGRLVWARRFGDLDYQSAVRAATDADGNVVVAGEFFGTSDFGAGPMTSAGLHDIFVAKLGPSGETLWVRQFGDPTHQYVGDMEIDRNGNAMLGGVFEGSVDFGNGPLISAGAQDAFVVKLDPDGNTVWSRRFGDSATQGLSAIAVDRDGHVIAVVEGLPAPRLFKLDAAGEEVWGRELPWPGMIINDLAAGATGALYLAGQHSVTIDLGTGPIEIRGFTAPLIAKLDASGRTIWARSAGVRGGHGHAASIASDRGLVAVAGGFAEGLDLGDVRLHGGEELRLFAATLDDHGNARWARDAGPPGAGAIAMSSGRLFLTGILTGTIRLDGRPVTGDGDIFVAAFCP